MHHSPGTIGALVSLCALLSLAFVGLPTFAIYYHRSGRVPSDRIRRLGGSRLLGMYIMEYGYWLAHLPFRAARRLGVTPDMVTLVGLATVVASAVCLAFGEFGIGGWLFLVGCIFDTVDGMLARAMNVCSDAGEFLDAAVDRYTEMAVLGGLAIYYRDRPWAMAVMLAAIIGSVMVSYNRAKAESLGVTDAPGWLMRRHERGVYIGLGVALAPLLAALVERGAAHPVYHLAVAAVALVALLSNIAAVVLLLDVRRRLRAAAARSAP